MLYQFLVSLSLPYLFLASYLGAPVLLGIAARHQALICALVTDPRKHARKTKDWVRFRVRHWTVEHYLSYAILILMGAFLLLIVTQLCFHRVKPYAVWMVISFLAISFAVLATVRYKLIALYKRLSWIINILVLLVGLYVASESSAVCDDTIAEFTNLNASNFPAAQRAITTWITAGYWIFYSTTAGLALCILSMWVLSSFRLEVRALAKSKYIPGVTNRNLKKKLDKHAPLVNSTLTISLLYVSITVATYFSTLTPHKINAFAKHLLVKYSFHVSPTVCGLSARQTAK